MEAALCGTPSVALAVGGLTESIVDGETGFLARSDEELVTRVREVVESTDLRDRLGDAARERAATFTWDRSAGTFLDVLRRTAGLAPADGEGGAGAEPVNGSDAGAERWLARNR
jgi:glycosyltransferase involved in cell wall biosynthesis